LSIVKNIIFSDLPRSFDNFVKGVALFVYALMIVVVGLQILVRWVLGSLIGSSLPWTVNLSQLLMVFVTFLGAAVASSKREHISLDLLSSRLSDSKIRVLAGLRSVLVLVFVSVMVAGAYPLYQQNKGFVIGALPAQPPFTKAWLYVSVVVGGLSIAVYGVRDLWAVITNQASVVDELKRDGKFDN